MRDRPVEAKNKQHSLQLLSLTLLKKLLDILGLSRPSNPSKTIMHYYPKRNIVIEEDKNADKTTYDLVLTHKW